MPYYAYIDSRTRV